MTSSHHSVTSWTDDERAALAELAADGPLSILVVYDHVPRPDAAGADLRLFQIVEFLARAGHHLTFLARSGVSQGATERHVRALQERGIEVLGPDRDRVLWERIDAPQMDVEALLRERAFDLAVLYQYFWVGIGVAEQYEPLLRAASPSTRVLLLSDDVHWLRECRRAEQSGVRADVERARGLCAKELETYRRADLVLTITREDAARMEADLPGLAPELVHFCQDEIPSAVPPFAQRRGLLFLGSGHNDANVQAVQWFVREVLPHVRAELPDIELSIVGEPPARGWRCEDAPGVRVLGRADALEEHLDRARVFVSPITYGTGLKTKNVQALGRGLPIVLSSISAEGMELSAEAGGDAVALIRDDAPAFADAVVSLVRDERRWTSLSQRSIAHAHTHFSRAHTIRDLARVVARARTRPLSAHRSAEYGVGLRVQTELSEHFPNGRAKNRTAAHLELARRWREAGRLDDAKQELRNAFCELCCLPPDARVFAQLHLLLSVVYLTGGEMDEAAAAAREALALVPDMSDEDRRVLESVLAAARAHEETRPTSADRLAESKRAYLAGEFELAAQCVLAVLREDERCADAWNSLGVFLCALGDRADAQGAFERALSIEPENADARANLDELLSA